MQFIYLPFKGLNNAVIHLRGLAGSNYDEKGTYGTAHLTEHLISSSNLFTVLTERGVKIISVTSRDDVLYMFKCANHDVYWTVKQILKIFNLFSFTDKQLEKQKILTGQEIQRFESSPEKLISRIGLKNVFNSDRLNYYNIGKPEDIKNINISQINNFVKHYFYPDNFVLTVTGDLDKNKLLKEVKHIASCSKSKVSRIKVKPNPNFVINLEKYPAFKQTYVRICYPGYPLKHKHSLYLEVLAHLADSHLKLLLKDKQLLTYDPGAVNYSSYSYGVFNIFFSCQAPKEETILKETTEMLKTYSKQLNQITFEKGKQEIITQLSYEMDKASFRGDYFSTTELFDSELKDYKTIKNAINEIKYEKIKLFAKKYFTQNPKLTVINDALGATKIKMMFN